MVCYSPPNMIKGGIISHTDGGFAGPSWRLAVTVVAMALSAACRPHPEPATGRAVPARGTTAERVVAPSPAEPDWTNRYAYWIAEWSSRFTPPAPGSALAVELVHGFTREGVLEHLDAQVVTLAVPDGSITLERTALSPASREALFAQDFAAPQAMAEVTKEKAAFDERARHYTDPDRFVIRDRRHAGSAVSEDGRPVPEVEAYIASHVRDAASVQFVKWYPLQEYERGYYVRCVYRTDGGSFGLINEDKVFYLNRKREVVRTSAGTALQSAE